MAINWNQAEYVSPKLQITPDQLPLEAGMKVGEVLQGRYDKAIETDTKIGALTKKLMGSVDPSDQELAKEITATYGARLKERASKGDYQNMQWQTMADADDFANIYIGLTNKAQQMQKYRDYIDTHKGIVDPNMKAWMKKDWESKQAKSTFDKENRFVSGLHVSAPNLVEDTDFAKFADSFASGWKADSGGGKTGKTVMTKPGDKLADGTISAGGMYNETSKHTWEKVKDTDIIKGLNDYAKASPALQATIDRDVQFGLSNQPLREGETLAQRRASVEHDNMDKAWKAASNKFGYTSNYSDVQSEYNTQLNAALAKTTVPANGNWTQLPSAEFVQPQEKDLFDVSPSGDIIKRPTKTTGLQQFNAFMDFLGGQGSTASPSKTFAQYSENLTKPSVERTRIINHLNALGVLKKGDDVKTTNTAIANFWNRLANAESSISVPQPGDEKANKYLDEINKTYFGNSGPDATAKGTSVKEGQLAQRTFVNEKGELMSPQQVFEETKSRNVRVNGVVDQYKSPFEYGSHYMVAAKPNNGEQQHYLISPDINTKNSGAYAANQIYNSINKKSLKSSWSDGQGIKYEATPLNGGKEFVVYVNGDIKHPIILDQNVLDQLSQVSPGNVPAALQSLLK